MLPRRINGLLLRGLGIVGNGGFDLENELCLREGNSGVDSFKNPGKRMVGGCVLNIYDPRRPPHCATGERGLLKQAPRDAPMGRAGEGIEE